MRIALYRRAFDGKLLDNAINAFSGFGGFSHAELVFSDGMSFSSTTRDPEYCRGEDAQGKWMRKDGVRFKRIDYTAHPERWAFFDIDARPSDERIIRAWAEQQAADRNASYDYGGVYAFVWPWSKADPAEWFCSEVVIAAVQHCGAGLMYEYGMGDVAAEYPHKISPNRLAKILGIR